MEYIIDPNKYSCVDIPRNMFFMQTLDTHSEFYIGLKQLIPYPPVALNS